MMLKNQNEIDLWIRAYSAAMSTIDLKIVSERTHVHAARDADAAVEHLRARVDSQNVTP